MSTDPTINKARLAMADAAGRWLTECDNTRAAKSTADAAERRLASAHERMDLASAAYDDAFSAYMEAIRANAERLDPPSLLDHVAAATAEHKAGCAVCGAEGCYSTLHPDEQVEAAMAKDASGE